MPRIKSALNEYHGKIDALDLELLLAHVINKPREFVLAHPEYKIPATRNPKLEALIKRRVAGEPLAYILGRKEFFGLDFKVNRNTLIPRPETELLTEEALNMLLSMLRSKLRSTAVIDVGTGSGNLIISIAKRLRGCSFYGIDISEKSLRVAKLNAKKNKVAGKIKFLKGDLLEPILDSKGYRLKANQLVIVANLPYLSKDIYAAAPASVRKFEPRSALLSGKDGLAHYRKLLQQIRILKIQHPRLRVSCFMEISPEQKYLLPKLLKALFPDAKIGFRQDLAGKWRLIRITTS